MQFLPTLDISSLLGPNIVLSTSFSKALSRYSSLNVKTKFYTHIKNKLYIFQSLRFQI